MITLTAPISMPLAEADDDLVHTVCSGCDPDLALCGKDMTGREWLAPVGYPDDCVVCDDLNDAHQCDTTVPSGRDVSDGGHDA